MTKLDPQVERELRRGVSDIIPERDFFGALESGRSLRLKLGLDPSKPDLHIGHGVLLRKLRLLQGMGHQVVLIVGDWTAQIGDPSGQSVMRPMLMAEEVRANAETYMRQFFYVVDKTKTEVRWQSEWFDKFTLADSIRLAARFTVAQMLQREDFRTRYEAQNPLGVHELFYPLLQAYDSVVIESDVEFGGTDQLFNLLVGRELQEEMGQRPQICVTMRLLVGTDGAQKMSKSLGNTIDFEAPPSEKYGKVMSIPDSALMDYLELATDIPDEELAYIRKQLDERSINPMEIKKRLAREIVAQFHGEAAAQEAKAAFSAGHREGHYEGILELSGKLTATQITKLFDAPGGSVFVRHVSDDVKEIVVPSSHPAGLDFPPSWARPSGPGWSIFHILVDASLASSISDARRLVRQGAVEVAGKKLDRDYLTNSELNPGTIIRVGKHRFIRIVDSDSGKSS